MESTMNPASDPAQSAGSRLIGDLAGGAIELKGKASGEIRNLMADVKELVTRAAGVKDPDIASVRNKLLDALDALRTSMSASGERVRERALTVAGTTNNFVHENPWRLVGIAALLGAAVGYLARRRL
jgi:ElaB/YqjD/DUF883 family membrane-anchored ribosome-binding protein